MGKKKKTVRRAVRTREASDEPRRARSTERRASRDSDQERSRFDDRDGRGEPRENRDEPRDGERSAARRRVRKKITRRPREDERAASSARDRDDDGRPSSDVGVAEERRPVRRVKKVVRKVTKKVAKKVAKKVVRKAAPRREDDRDDAPVSRKSGTRKSGARKSGAHDSESRESESRESESKAGGRRKKKVAKKVAKKTAEKVAEKATEKNAEKQADRKPESKRRRSRSPGGRGDSDRDESRGRRPQEEKKARSSRKASRRMKPSRGSRGSAPARPMEGVDGKEKTKRKYAPGEGKSDRRILISTREDQESRVCVMAENRLEELYIDRAGDSSYLGNVYVGRVVNLEPSIGAAFVDFGEGKNGFLHASDVTPCPAEGDRIGEFLSVADPDDEAAAQPRTDDRNGEDRKNIDELLEMGELIVVQITKDGIGHKGPTLTTYISIPGCYLVLMPNLRRTGVSRKISDNDERRRLREILKGLDLPDGLGFIIRTAGEDHPRQDLERDAQFLMKMWTLVARRLRGAKGPIALYRETDLILRSLRDLFTPDTVGVVVDTERHHRRCLDFMKNVMPQYADRVELHDQPKPLFTAYGMDLEVERVFQRKIQLRAGGSIVLDQAEALVAIDVNSGKNKEESDLEETALKTNLEAIPEIVRQLRLRDLGGLVIIDFIDMMEDRYRRRVERALLDELRKDRARFRMEGMSMFGIIELTRQRVRPSLFVAASATCPACSGLGTVKSAESVSHTILRRIRGAVSRQKCQEIEVRLHPLMASYFQNAKRGAILEIEENFEKTISVTFDPLLRYEELRLAYHDRARNPSMELQHHL